MNQQEIDYYFQQARQKFGIWRLVYGICINPFMGVQEKRSLIEKHYQISPKKVTMKITIDDEIAELTRELAMRKSFYKKQVELGKMSRDKANKQYLTMQQTLQRLKGIKAKESRQTQLPL